MKIIIMFASNFNRLLCIPITSECLYLKVVIKSFYGLSFLLCDTLNVFICRLCRLLTNPSPHVKDLVPDFLFTLCKENGEKCLFYCVLL